ncbi:hypothetical protein B0H12DRAFT_1147133, partial [Mycena haematopus]
LQRVLLTRTRYVRHSPVVFVHHLNLRQISRHLHSCAHAQISVLISLRHRHLCESMWDDAAAMGRATLMERATAMGRRNTCGTAQRLWQWDGGLGSRST